MEKLSNKLSTVNDFAELKRESSYHKPQTHDSSSSSSGGFLSSCSRMALCIILCYLRLVFSVQLHKKKSSATGWSKVVIAEGPPKFQTRYSICWDLSKPN